MQLIINNNFFISNKIYQNITRKILFLSILNENETIFNKRSGKKEKGKHLNSYHSTLWGFPSRKRFQVEIHMNFELTFQKRVEQWRTTIKEILLARPQNTLIWLILANFQFRSYNKFCYNNNKWDQSPPRHCSRNEDLCQAENRNVLSLSLRLWPNTVFCI